MVNNMTGDTVAHQYQTRDHDGALDVSRPDLDRRGQSVQLKGRWRLFERLRVGIATHILPTRTGHLVEIAKNIRSPWLVDRLARHTNGQVAAGAAMNIDLPAQTIDYLASHESDLIRSRLARRFDLPADISQRLAQDVYNVVRSRIAQNVATPPEVLTYMVRNDPNAANRQRAIRNPSCPPQVRALALIQGDILPDLSRSAHCST